MPQSLFRTVLFLMTVVLAGCSSADWADATAESDVGAAQVFDSQAQDGRPNILLLVADDMGYSDIGAFGSEISTPNLDRLAAEGVVMTNFKVGPACSPTRGMLYSGTDNHRNGLGTMNGMESDEQRGQPGYETYLNRHVVTFMTLLKDAGYHTYLSGKWQQGYSDGHFPLDRGFERAYWLMSGGANHFADPRSIFDAGQSIYYREDEEVLEEFPEDHYSASTQTSKLIEYIDSNKDDGKPFFAMASFTTPHWPLQAPDEYIEKYEGVYDSGYDEIREARIERMKSLGILKPGVIPAPLHPSFSAWQDLSDEMREREIKRMQVYAAMVDIMDENIGRLVAYLQQAGLYENTVILFFSDNGAEGNDPGLLADTGNFRLEGFDNSLDNIGRPGSFTIQGPGWAHVSNTPFYLHKGFPSEGGISTPFIATNPRLIPGGRKSDAFATVLDVLPTFLALAATEHPGAEYKGRQVFTPIGTSMLPFLKGETEKVHPDDYVYAGELWNRRVVRQGNWKMSLSNAPWGSGDWALFDLSSDIGEQNDLADQYPDKVAELASHWEDYQDTNGVIVNPDFYLRYSNENGYIQE